MVAAQWRLVALVALFATPSCSLHVGAPLAPRFATVAATVSSSSSPALITPSRSSVFDVVMQEDGRETSKSRGRTAVIQRPKPKPKQSSKEEVDHDKSWRVLLHNDDVHTFDYVTMAIVKVVKTITRKKAHRITVQCHAAGTATVTTTWKAMAKTMCLKLQKFGLTSSIAPDS